MKKLEPPIWRDGKFIGWSDANVHVFSHAVSRGTAVFEVLTAELSDFGTALFRPVDHLRRLERSARYIGMNLPLRPDDMLDAMRKTVRAMGHAEAIVKVVALWPGVGFDILPRGKNVSVFITAIPKPPPIHLKGTRKKPGGVSARVVSVRKLDPATIPVQAKVAANYLNPMLAKAEVEKKRTDLSIMLDTKGCLAEGATESLFIVRKGKLLTPGTENILPGITRDTVIKLARNKGIPVIEKRLKPSALDDAEEVFFTTSPEGIISASRVNSRRIGDGKPGPVTKMLDEEFEKAVRGRIAKYMKWLVPVR